MGPAEPAAPALVQILPIASSPNPEPPVPEDAAPAAGNESH
jgi:hypothetical protein